MAQTCPRVHDQNVPSELLSGGYRFAAPRNQFIRDLKGLFTGGGKYQRVSPELLEHRTEGLEGNPLRSAPLNHKFQWVDDQPVVSVRAFLYQFQATCPLI